MSGVHLKQLTKRYGDVQVIHGVDLDIKDGEFCVFVGPSGCGKSTLLRMIAGLEDTTQGQITIGAYDVTNADLGRRGGDGVSYLCAVSADVAAWHFPDQTQLHCVPAPPLQKAV